MTSDHLKKNNSHQTSRREFLKLTAITGATSLLVGCNATQQSRPNSTAPIPTATQRPQIIQFYPDVPSKVVHAHHAGVWDGEELVPEAVRHMLDTSITELTGLEDARDAWAALFAPDETIAIKVNAFRNSLIWTHVPLVTAVTDSLQEAGIPAEQIVIFDAQTQELETADFAVNKEGPGVRCYGNDLKHTGGWTIIEQDVKLSNILLSCDALINMPILKSHMIAGLTFAMKNHFGSISYPSSYHHPIGRAVAELNALEPIKERTRLIVGDILTACLEYKSAFPYWKADYTGDAILMSHDPVAHDTVGLEILKQLVDEAGHASESLVDKAEPYLIQAAELGLGTNDLAHIDWAEIDLS